MLKSVNKVPRSGFFFNLHSHLETKYGRSFLPENEKKELKLEIVKILIESEV